MSIRQYLARYAEPEIEASSLVSKTYQRVLCIPAYAETPEFLLHLSRAFLNESVLIILTVNAPDNGDPDKLIQTRNLLSFIKTEFVVYEENQNTCLVQLSSITDLLVIDRCSERHSIPEKQGVGLARKIACDIATQLISENKINSPWIHSSDADTFFPEGYFSVTDTLDTVNISAILYPFRHIAHRNEKTKNSQRLYDLSLHYYVEGLRMASSPYAFHTIGSTLVINHNHYAKVRGFPKRNAAEDFYLLNKLAKTGEIKSLEQPELDIETRISDRVPFGTGPALNTIMMLANPKQDYLFYNPEVFFCLTTVLSSFPSLWRDKSQIGYSPLIEECLKELKFKEGLAHALQQSSSQEKFLKHMHDWFDAFKTLKFIHLLRDKKLSSLTLAECENNKVFKTAQKKLRQAL